MQLFNLLTALFFHTLATLAAPAPAPAAEASFNAPAPYDFISLAAAGKNIPSDFTTTTGLAKRNLGGVRMSDGANFTGHVWYGAFPLNTCIDLRD